MHELLTLQEAADLLQVHRTTLARWLNKGQLAHWKLPDGTRQLRRSDIELLAKERQPQFIEAAVALAESA